MARLLTHQAEGTLESLAQQDSHLDSRFNKIVAQLGQQKELVKAAVYNRAIGCKLPCRLFSGCSLGDRG